MISQKTIDYIFQAAHKQKLTVPSNYMDILDNYCNMALKLDCTLTFTELSGSNPDGPHAEARGREICASPAWAAQLVLHDNEETRNAFMMTLGHEKSHNDQHRRYLFPSLAFIRHVREVYCDFSGAQKMCGRSRKKLVQSFKYKINFKQSVGEKDVDDCFHPSWERRLFYAKNFNFGEDLIKQIAKNVRCRNLRLIYQTIYSYDDIILIDDMEGETN